ncbi:MAG TPA: restriction endonuclease [Candidatus Babeliales bacterium]|nr:restriction endonuclease [Candidatus Babeliales bacterium]
MISKSSGELEAFDINKFKKSLKKVGVKEELIEQLAREIEHRNDIKTTHDIYRFAFNKLKDITPGIASRYNLKQALLELGPAGYPFEKYISHLFAAQGFTTKIDQIIPGKCIEHEIDILLSQEKANHGLVECKFHNSQGIKTNVKVILYIQARFDDIKEAWETNKKNHKIDYAWVVTNTKFTTQAIAYGECRKIRMLSWNYPSTLNLANLIDRYGLHPVTALSSLTTREKKFFLQSDLVLCKDIKNFEYLFSQLKLSKKKIEKIISESEAICSL